MLKTTLVLAVLSVAAYSQELVQMPIHGPTGLNISYESSKIGVCRHLGFQDYSAGSSRKLKDPTRGRFNRGVKMETVKLDSDGLVKKIKKDEVLASIVCISDYSRGDEWDTARPSRPGRTTIDDSDDF